MGPRLLAWGGQEAALRPLSDCANLLEARVGGGEPWAEAFIVLSLGKPASQALTAELRGAATPAREGRAGGRAPSSLPQSKSFHVSEQRHVLFRCVRYAPRAMG